MQAVVTRQYGSPDVLELTEVAQPVPAPDEVLVRVHAASVNAGDWHLLRADPFLVRLMFGLTKPKFEVLGADIAGVVEAVGAEVRRFQVGDAVHADLSQHKWGAFAEYALAREQDLAPKPAALSFEEAACVPAAGVTALQGVRDHGQLQPGQQVLIHGASGGVGTYALQIAKALGAEVTAVCSTAKVELVRSLGADHVIDYTQEDFAAGGERFDLIHAVNGKRPLRDYESALKPGGRYVMSGGAMSQFFEVALLGPWRSWRSGKRLGNYLVKPNGADLAFLDAWIEAGKVRPVVDSVRPLSEVPDAIRELEAGHVRGKLAICVAPSSST